MFKEGGPTFPPPDRYKLRVLKKLLESMEKAIEDPEEDVGHPYMTASHSVFCFLENALLCACSS